MAATAYPRLLWAKLLFGTKTSAWLAGTRNHRWKNKAMSVIGATRVPASLSHGTTGTDLTWIPGHASAAADQRREIWHPSNTRLSHKLRNGPPRGATGPIQRPRFHTEPLLRASYDAGCARAVVSQRSRR